MCWTLGHRSTITCAPYGEQDDVFISASYRVDPTSVVYSDHTTSELQGVESIAKTHLCITNTGRSFYWAGYGLKLSFPADCLPPAVEECFLTIQASISGQYQFPGDTTLVSAVFWFKCKPRVTFKQPFTLEIQNCAKPENYSKLRFYCASSSQQKLPYSFQPLEQGVFASHNSYSSVQLDHFSGVTVGQEEDGRRFAVPRYSTSVIASGRNSLI